MIIQCSVITPYLTNGGCDFKPDGKSLPWIGPFEPISIHGDGSEALLTKLEAGGKTMFVAGGPNWRAPIWHGKGEDDINASRCCRNKE